MLCGVVDRRHTSHNKNVSGSVRFAHSPYMARRGVAWKRIAAYARAGRRRPLCNGHVGNL